MPSVDLPAADAAEAAVEPRGSAGASLCFLRLTLPALSKLLLSSKYAGKYSPGFTTVPSGRRAGAASGSLRTRREGFGRDVDTEPRDV